MSRFTEWLAALPLVSRLRQRIAGSGVASRLLNASLWLVVGNAFWRVPSAVSTIVVGRILGPQGFGELGMINSTVQVFASYAGLRLGTTTTRYLAEHRRERPEKAARILKLTLSVSLVSCAVAGVALAVLAPWLAQSALNQPSLAGSLALAGALLFFLIYGSVQEMALTGFESFRALAKVGALRGVATPLFCIPMAYLWGVNGAVVGLTSVAALAFVWLVVLLRRERVSAGLPLVVPMREARSEASVLWGFALPSFLTAVLFTATLWVGRAMLVRHQSGYAELGLFEAANQWRTLILFLPGIMVRAVVPMLAESYGRRDTNEFGHAVSLQVLAVCIATVPLVVITMGAAEWLAAVFGARFAGTDRLIPVLMISVFFFGLNQAIRQVYDGAGRPWAGLVVSSGWAAVLVSLAWLLVPSHGAIGLAWANVGAETAAFLGQSIFVDRVLAPGALRRRTGILAISIAAIGLQYSAWLALPALWSALSALALTAMAVGSGFVWLHRRG
jgi:O-antigen/teichoic acid export membrane protein